MTRRALVSAVAAVLLGLVPAASANGVQASAAIREESLAGTTALPTVGGTWIELTTLPYDLEDPRYRAEDRDQWFPGSGVGLAGGRVQALAVDGDTVYAGAATGGVWRS